MRFGIVSFPRHTLDQSAQAVGVELDLPGGGEFQAVRAADWAGLTAAYETVVKMAAYDVAEAPSERAAAELSSGLLDVVVRSFAADQDSTPPNPRARLNSVRIARACEDRAVQMRYQGVTLADLCDASGASERRVRDAFYESYGLSPMAYLRIAALHGARHALLTTPRGHDPISRAASDFGFWHLSRFAGQYRALFGESPSGTLDRRAEAKAS
jgi:AraC-like DNA-binding protein